MPNALLQCLHMTIKMACDGGTLVVSADILLDTTSSQGQCYGPLKLTLSSNINLIGVISLFVFY